jgi:hypothetical protein
MASGIREPGFFDKEDRWDRRALWINFRERVLDVRSITLAWGSIRVLTGNALVMVLRLFEGMFWWNTETSSGLFKKISAFVPCSLG